MDHNNESETIRKLKARIEELENFLRTDAEYWDRDIDDGWACVSCCEPTYAHDADCKLQQLLNKPYL